MEPSLLTKSSSRCCSASSLFSCRFFNVSTTSSHRLGCSCRFESLEKAKQSLRNRLLGVAKKSNFFRLQRLTFDISSTEQFHIHTIKSGETLKSISKQYGVSIYAIAAVNMEIKDVDFVLEGQKLKIPAKLDLQKVCSYQLDRCHSLLDEHLVPKSQKLICNITSSFLSKTMKNNSDFVMLAPLIAFCIGCVIQMLRNSLANRTAKAGFESHNTRSRRWKAVIYDSEFSNNSDTEPLEESSVSADDGPS